MIYITMGKSKTPQEKIIVKTLMKICARGQNTSQDFQETKNYKIIENNQRKRVPWRKRNIQKWNLYIYYKT